MAGGLGCLDAATWAPSIPQLRLNKKEEGSILEYFCRTAAYFAYPLGLIRSAISQGANGYASISTTSRTPAMDFSISLGGENE
jgi:hypothetical protein